MNDMIAFVTKGYSFRGSVEYDFSPCKISGKPRAEYVGGTLCGTPRQMAKQVAPLRALRDVTNPVWRVSLNADTLDGVLSLQKWDEISNFFLSEMGLATKTAAWCSVRHTDHHHDPVPRDGVHISVIRVQPDGSLFTIENDVYRAIQVTKKIEEKFGLKLHSRERAERRAPSNAQIRAEKRTGKMATREEIQNYVDQFFDEEVDLTFNNLKQKLFEKGVEIRASQSKKGRIQGFSYKDLSIGVALPGSKLGTRYSLGLLTRGLKYDQKYDQKDELQNVEQNIELKEKIQKIVDETLNHQKLPIEWEQFADALQRRAIRILLETERNGRENRHPHKLLSFSYEDVQSGVVIAGADLGDRYNLGLLERGVEYYESEKAEAKPDSKMPAMLKPLILPQQYGAKEIRPLAAHQTEVTLSTEKYNSQVVNLQIGPASKVMLLIGGLLAQASVFLIEKIIAFLKRLLQAFGFGIRQSDIQKHTHTDPNAPALCYEPTQLALPAPKSAEDQAADELFRVAQALEQNDSSLLPVVEGAEKEREAVQAAMDDVGGKGGGATADAENFDFGISDEDFGSTNAVSEPPNVDPLDELKEALAAHKIAKRALELAEIKDGPIHFSSVNQKQNELKIVREDLDTAKSKWDDFCTQHAMTWRLPSVEKTRLRQNVDNNLEAEKRAVKAVEMAEAEDARIKKLYASLPPAIVPVHIKQAEDQAIRAVTSARIALQREAEAAIKAIRSDIMMSPKMAKLESLLKASYSRFAIVGEITDSEFGVLQSQIEELRRIKAAQENARIAASADHEADKPVIDGQIVK